MPCRLGSTFAELANAYYRDEGRRVKTRLERKSYSSIELNIRYSFKVGDFFVCAIDQSFDVDMYAYQNCASLDAWLAHLSKTEIFDKERLNLYKIELLM